MTAISHDRVVPAANPGRLSQLSLALRLARRELRGGLKGFRIFLACLILGVGAIAAVQSLSSGILDALRADGRAILGGDVAVRQLYREITPEQLAWLTGQGTVAVNAEMRGMARLPADPARTSLVELKAVSPAYPLYGAMSFRDGDAPLHERLAQRDGIWGAVAEETLALRLGLKEGDRLGVGDIEVQLRGIIASEPDRAGGGGLSLGPRLMIAGGALPASGLQQPGSMITWSYLVKLPGGTDLKGWQDQLKAAFPDAGWRTRDFTNAAPQLTRFIDRLTQFLTLVGMTSLLVGGVGVGNAVRAYMESKTETIATLKCLGARGGLVFEVYLAQILALSAIGILAGLVLGAGIPVVAGRAMSGMLPVAANIGIYPGALAVAAGFGLLTALVFSLWPLGRAREVPAASLFRETVAGAKGRPRGIYLIMLTVAALALAGLAVATSTDRGFAAAFVLGSAATLLAFGGAGKAVSRIAARLPRPKRPGLRLALANLHRPGNPTATVVLSLGLGLTVLVAIALIEGNFRKEVQETLPEDAPAFFFLDIQPNQLAQFRDTIAAVPGTSDLQVTPSLRGRISKVNGKPAEEAIVAKQHSWVLQGDRGVTYQAKSPGKDVVVAGAWWPEDYQGPPKLAIYKDIAEAFGIGPGAVMTLNILGRDIDAEVAVVRDLDFSSLGINFTLVLSPGVLEGAPQTHIATVRAVPEAEQAVQRNVAAGFTNVTAVRIKEALETVNKVLTDIGAAVRMTAAVSLIAGTLVLAGAIAAGHRRRVYDAVVLKVLGATRGTIVRAFLVEYGLLGLITALIAGVLGTVVAWAVLTQVMELDFTFMPGAVLATAALSTAITLGLGFLGTWRALGQPAAPLLRND
ncbi:MAG TPA: FtsX-like permease family protein [Azospirillaceae bacterium]|nr:FtsX-like permease family protein [Azospirillaceae bacterium]